MNDSYILIGQYYGTSLTSRLIRWRTWSKISHTSAFVGPLTDEVIEAWGGGVVRRPWTEGHTPGTKIELYRVACTLEQRQRFYAFLEAQVGCKYDFWGILGFALRIKSQRSLAWFCSELIFAAAKFAGIDLLSRIEPYQVAPGDINISPLLELMAVRICP